MALSRADCREIQQVLAGKATNYRYADLERWLRRADYTPPTQTDGTHRVWTKQGHLAVTLVEKGHGQLLPVYVKDTAKSILGGGLCAEHDER